MKGPNDLVFDRTGGFWFSDHGKTHERQVDRGGLYYARPDGSHVEEVVFPVEGPNGVGLSPDEDWLYVAETHTGRVRKWRIAEPGRLESAFGKGTRGDLVVGLPGEQLLDSLAVDGEGHVCVATIRNGGITDIDPADGSTVHVPTGDPLTTNICFGGPDLRTAYITCSRRPPGEDDLAPPRPEAQLQPVAGHCGLRLPLGHPGLVRPVVIVARQRG